jgi:hypothetical protein
MATKEGKGRMSKNVASTTNRVAKKATSLGNKKEKETLNPHSKKKTIMQMYQKMMQLEHIRSCPDTYISSIESVMQHMFVYNSLTRRILQHKITYSPGLCKIFKEIVVNTSYNKQCNTNMGKHEVNVDMSRTQYLF